MNIKTYYDILEIDNTASYKKIKIAYRNKIKYWHPDKNTNSLEAEEMTKLINFAYSILSDPKKRFEYDEIFKNTEKNEYSKNYSENSLWEKFRKVSLKAGSEIICKCLQLYFVLKKPDVPMWVKATITGALGYFILPIDAIPDLVPIVGFTDDLGAIVSALGVASMYIDDEVNTNVKEKMLLWFNKDDLIKLGIL